MLDPYQTSAVKSIVLYEHKELNCIMRRVYLAYLLFTRKTAKYVPIVNCNNGHVMPLFFVVGPYIHILFLSFFFQLPKRLLAGEFTSSPFSLHLQ